MRAYIEISSVVALTSRLSLAAVMNHPALYRSQKFQVSDL